MLSSAIARGKPDIADRLVSLRSHPIVQRRLTTAAEDGDVSLEEIREAADNIEGARHLDDAELREILADAGDEGAEALSSMPSEHIDLLSRLDASPQLKARYIRNYNDLAPDVEYRARRLVETEPGALRFAGEVDGDAFERLLRSDLSDDQLRRAIDKYDELDVEYGRQFREVLEETDASESWVRAVSDDAITDQSIRRALDITEEISDDVEIDGFRASSNIDYIEDEYYSEWYDDVDSMYPADEIAIEGTTKADAEMYRFWKSHVDGHVAGPWYTDADDIDRLFRRESTGVEEVRSRYALPDPGENLDNAPDMVSKFEVERGTNVRIGTVGPNWDQPGGGVQYEIRHPSMKKRSSDIVLDDLPAEETFRGDLEDFLSD